MLCQYLQRPGRIALAGLPGVGKTTLAAYIAHLPEIQSTYPEGVLWMNLGQTPDIASILAQLAMRVGISASELKQFADPARLAQQIQTVIGNRQIVMVYDDVWHLEDLALLAFANDAISLLITTRFPGIAHAFALEHTILLSEFDEPSSLDLFRSLAPAVIERYPTEMQEIASVSGRLPLALTLIGRYLQIQWLSGNARRLQTALSQLQDASFRLALSEIAPVTEQHRWQDDNGKWSLQASIRLSVESLNPTEQALLHLLAIFPAKSNTFSEEAGHAVSGLEPQPYLIALDRLVDAGLVENPVPDRYAIHQTIVEYLGTPPISFEALQSLADHYITLAERSQDDYAELEPELPNVLTIMDVTLQLYGKALVRLTQHVAMFLSLRGRHAEAEALVQRCRGTMQPSDDSVEQIALLILLGRAIVGQGRLEEGLAAAEEACDMALQAHLAEMEASGWQLRGEILHRLGDLEQEEDNYDRGWQIIQGIPPQHPINFGLIASLMLGLGNIASQHGDVVEAERWFQQGLADARQRNSSRKECTFLLSLGIVASERGNYETAYQYFLGAKDIAERIQYADHLMVAYIDLTKAAEDMGKLDLALQWGETAVAICRKIGNHERLCGALENLGSTLTELGQYEAAEKFVREGLSLAEEIGNVRWQISLLVMLGTIYRRQGDTEAETILQRVIHMAQTAQLYWITIDTDLELGEWYLEHGAWKAALAHFEEAYQAAERAESRDRQGQALFGKARVVWALGDLEAAKQTAEESLNVLRQVHSRHVREVELWQESHLDPEQVSANGSAPAED